MAFIHITEDDGSLTLHSETSNHRFQMPAIDKVAQALLPGTAFDQAVTSLGVLIDKTREASNDARLSELGKEERLAAVREQAIEDQARLSGAVDHFEREVDQREAALLAVPKLDPTHSAVAIEDREIRDWWRTQTLDKRIEMLLAFNETPDYQRIEIALLRSPIALVDQEAALLRESWNRAKRIERPADAMYIDSARASIDWARRGLGQTAGLTAVVAKLDRSQILRRVVTSQNEVTRSGFGVFGFSKSDADNARRLIESGGRIV